MKLQNNPLNPRGYGGIAKYSNKKSSERSKKPTFTLGDMQLDQTEKYKYLGETLNNKNNMANQITEIKRKTEAAYQTIVTLAGNKNFKDIEMQTIWRLLETCITPIILHGSETWKTTKEETRELNRIYDNIIKRILMLPVTTPREVLYMETGLMDIETLTIERKLNMKQRIKNNTTTLIEKVNQIDTKSSWHKKVNELQEELKIEDDKLETKYSTKKEIRKKTQIHFKQETERQGKKKSKVQHLDEQTHWKPGTRKPYLDKLTRKQASTIFKARTRMLEIKENYKNMYKNNMKCRACGLFDETQIHVMNQCQKLHTDNSTKVFNAEINHQCNVIVKDAVEKIQDIIQKLEKAPPV